MLKTLFLAHRLIQRQTNVVCSFKNFRLFSTNNGDSNDHNIKSQQTKIEQHAPKIQQQSLKKEKKKKEQKPEQKNKDSDIQKEQIGPKFFSQIDLRIGEITQCWKHPQSQNLYCQKIDICSQTREIASGLQKFVAFQQMKGKVLLMANLKPRPLAGFLSNGMVMCACSQDGKIELIVPQGEVGQRVFLQNFQDLFTEGDIQPMLNPKKKVLERTLQHFKTDQHGFVIWKGMKVMTKAGPLKSNIKDGKVS